MADGQLLTGDHKQYNHQLHIGLSVTVHRQEKQVAQQSVTTHASDFEQNLCQHPIAYPRLHREWKMEQTWCSVKPRPTLQR